MARHEDGRGRRDAAGIGPYLHEGVRLASLRQLGWNVTQGDADVRGWEVRSINGRVIGTVADLLIDEQAGEVVLLDLDLAGTSRRAVTPIRSAQIDRTARVVLVDSGDVQDADRFPTPSRPARAESGAQAEEVREARNDLAVRESAHRAAVDMNAPHPGHDGPTVPRNGVVVEEVVVRRRVVDASDLPAAEAQGARVVQDDRDLARLDDDLIDDRR